MQKFLYASLNEGKFQEAQALARSFSVELISPSQLRESPPIVDEVGKTYEENALLKAQAFFKWSEIPCISDDAGLEVRALANAPGIHTARYGGDDANSNNNINKLLENMRGVKDRKARFVCVLCLFSGRAPLFIRETLEGSISFTREGAGGFGYDPIFIVDGYDKSLASLKTFPNCPKTHRIKALENMFCLISSGK